MSGLHQKKIAIKSLKNIDLRNKNLLDLGCGTGELSIEIFNKYQPKKFIGIDNNKPRINNANNLVHNQKLTNINFLHSEADSMKEIDNSSIDIILCNMAFQQFTNQIQSLKEIKRILRDNGCAIINFNEQKSHLLLEKIRITNELLAISSKPKLDKKIDLLKFKNLAKTIGFSKINTKSVQDVYYYKNYKSAIESIDIKDSRLTSEQNKILLAKFMVYLKNIKTKQGFPETWQMVFAKLTK